MYALKQHRPRFSEQQARQLAREIFGVDASACELPSERDQNFHLHDTRGSEFVLKIASASEKAEILDLQNQAMERIGAAGIPCPRVCPSVSGEKIASASGPDGTHFVRMLTFLPGVFFVKARPHTPQLLRSLGRFFGEVDKALQGFSHPAADRELVWNMKEAGSVIRRCKAHIRDSRRLAIVEQFLDRMENQVVPALPHLRTGIIHNDGNDYNVLVNAISPKHPDPHTREIVGIIDFGDMLHGITAADPAIAAAYALLDKPDPLSAAACVIQGYNEAFPLAESELEIIFYLICIRLATSVALSAYQRQQEPEKPYLSISEKPAWEALERLADIQPRFAHYIFRNVCGLAPCPGHGKVVGWLQRHAPEFGRVVDCDLQKAPTVTFDFSLSSPLAGSVLPTPLGDALCTAQNPGELERCRAFSQLLFGMMEAAGAQAGIGKYNEARFFYATDLYRTASNDLPETRTIHLGIDVFMKPGSPVFAPLDGTVHSFRNNDQLLDYGPAIILRHDIGTEGGEFFTLYGHLTKETLDPLRQGMPVRKGEKIAEIGNFPENGCWPPHLHFQIITDLLDRCGEFPGVAASRERDVWLSICPDPGLILGMTESGGPAGQLAADEIVAVRKSSVGRNLSVSYRRPLHIVRGYMQHLYDPDGHAYLDAVNNVPHVGHSNPRVVRAAQQQMSVLNTNTRYLHENIVRYARRLCATLPEPLRVCFFVSSGSEANDLALRLARAHTGQLDMIVVDGAYHGNLTSLIDLSPYKFDGPGGKGAPPHVHKVPTPDLYRGPYRAGTQQAGVRYAEHVRQELEGILRKGKGVAAFISESALSCAGQIILPQDYLREAYRHVRAAGGVCIADEVQVGFGRLGSRFWGFEIQEAVPDIVTMGKPIGNGHPLAAVVTTPEIAASFDNGMEYFSTYGGNPVSCAVGLAVLDEIERYGLQENALKAGNRLLNGIRELMPRQPIIGDVRGQGLFIGVELVLDRQTLEPAPAHASYIAERMKDLGVLLSTDGPLHNVLKIKPPIIFTDADADFLASTLERVLTEDYLRLS